jgi:hypothetical protein
MPRTFRIPQARIDGVHGAVMTRVARRMWVKVPDNAYVLWRRADARHVVRAGPRLTTYAEMASAGAIGCSWCRDPASQRPGPFAVGETGTGTCLRFSRVERA